jgi:hypothetical protein
MTAQEYFALFPDKRFEVSRPFQPTAANRKMVQVRFQCHTTMPATGTKEMFAAEVARFEQDLSKNCPLQCHKNLP